VDVRQVLGRSVLWVAALAISGAACGGSSSADYQLIQANHPECLQAGLAIAHYLETGQPTSFDPDWGTQRQQVLSLNGESRALFIRQQADAVIQACDARLWEREAAAAKAQQQARASASALAQAQADASARAAWVAQVSATCKKVGGTWTGGLCRIDYRSPDDGSTYHYTVSFDASGTVTPSGPRNADECATYYGSNIKGYWHADTDICAL
jgi:hypothetical protein